MGELRRSYALGETEPDHDEGRGIQGYGQPDARNDARRARVHAGLDRQHAYAVHQAVAEGRHAKEADIRAIADGKVWTGEQAASLKMVDQISDFEGAVKDTARAVNISGEPTLIWPPKEKRSGLDLLFGDVSDYLPTREKLLEQQVGFYYLWK